MNNLTELVVVNLRAIGVQALPKYEAMLDRSFAKTPPPFSEDWFGRRYFELARDREWFANSLVANSALEGYGSRQIWKFSNRVFDDAHVDMIRKHALDESRHSTMFISMLKLTFPHLGLDDATKQRLAGLQPRFSPHNLPPEIREPENRRLDTAESLNELIQVHITEIRALVLQFLLRAVIRVYCPDNAKPRLEMFTGSLIRDETSHIAYTASIFEDAATAGYEDFLDQTFSDRVVDFNDLTLIELEREEKVTI